jgi:hypothetical protein
MLNMLGPLSLASAREVVALHATRGFCDLYRSAAIRHRLGKVLKSSDMLLILHKGSKHNPQKIPECTYEMWLEGLTGFAEVAQQAGVPFVWIMDWAEIAHYPQYCLLRQAGEECTKARRQVLAEHHEMYSLAADLKKNHSGFYAFATLDKTCDNSGDCSIYVPGTSTIMYRDQHHLRGPGAYYLSPFLCSFFSENGLHV